jgi:hypothetical protein
MILPITSHATHRTLSTTQEQADLQANAAPVEFGQLCFAVSEYPRNFILSSMGHTK